MPRRPSASSSDGSSKNKPRVRFIFEPDRTSLNGITYFWLIYDAYNGKEKAATATSTGLLSGDKFPKPLCSSGVRRLNLKS